MSIKSWEVGRLWEKLFVLLATRRGFSVSKTNINEDKYSHVDFVVWNARLNFTAGVDVKFQSSFNSPPFYLTIQLKNPYGYNGWLFGKSQLFAFAITPKLAQIFGKPNHLGFVLIPKDDLIAYFHKHIDKTKLTTSRTDALTNGWLYTTNKTDRYFFVPAKRITELTHWFWLEPIDEQIQRIVNQFHDTDLVL